MNNTQLALIAHAKANLTNPDPLERAAAYRVLGVLAIDDRPGVLDFNFKVGDYWCLIPAGTYPLGNDEDNDNPRHNIALGPFYFAKYPVTNAQFQAFIDAPDGFNNTKWWAGMGEEALAEQQNGPSKSIFEVGNQARDSVSWFEAMAFCRWLSVKLGYEVRLPTEDEWEAAARGMDGREYPWGNGYRIGFANTNETLDDGPYYVDQTTAVGIYPQGASPYGVLDMAGNVWEWTLTDRSRRNDNLSIFAPRYVRGGSWDNLEEEARASLGGYDAYNPWDQISRVGFRIMCLAPAT